ncbi:MAG TPA: non-homologous end-joining DNA ligase [Verrucomicrobiae bacterium]|jgi:bifunctional non-homologous end joining protein LigD|nr:non-homologous end-joining DNA ligase [Verrucomicrobiae bacterium]
MALEEYKRKRRFESTPEPPPKVETKVGHRFVVQKHDATRLHYDFRLEMEGVLKSWAVPKGPSLDPADKRLAMQVEDHPVSYFDFEGIIPEGNYGAGTVMVWDVGTWQPLSPVAVEGKYVPGTEAEAVAMLAKGDLKFRLDGKKLKGDFALVKMKGRRPGSKGNEWLLIKKHDQYVVEGYDIDAYDESALSGRSLAQIAGDAGSAEWRSRPAGGGKLKAAWLADAVAKLDKKKAVLKTTTKKTTAKKKLNTGEHGVNRRKASGSLTNSASPKVATYPLTSVPSVLNALPSPTASSAGTKRPMPTTIHPMLATPVNEPFDGAEWLFEIKWDGYRAIAFIADGKLRLVSRNQNELTERFPELKDLPKFVHAKSAILDGEVVALDDQGRASFTLMQQRTGFRPGGRRGAAKSEVPVLYYAFDLLYLDGYDLRKLPLEDRKKKLASVLITGDSVRYSDHYEKRGKALFEMARAKGLEGILAKKRDSIYVERRTTEWLKIKITHRLEAVIGGYTEPEGSRAHFGSIVLGLYDKQGRLIHVGQAGSGFDQESLGEVWKLLKKRETKKNPFHGEVEALRKVYWVKPELVAEIEFSEWTGGASAGSGPKLRAPVFLGLRDDKDPKDCLLEQELKI